MLYSQHGNTVELVRKKRKNIRWFETNFGIVSHFSKQQLVKQSPAGQCDELDSILSDEFYFPGYVRQFTTFRVVRLIPTFLRIKV